MFQKYLKFLASVSVAGLFMWLALKDISLQDLKLMMDKMTWNWVIPYVLVSLLAHFIRAERWRLFIEQEGEKTRRLTLFSGVMLGYMVNYAVPRLGEVSRSVYVGNKEGISRTRLMGTVVLERFLDLLVLVLLVLWVVFYMLTDHSMIAALLGRDAAQALRSITGIQGLALSGLAIAVLILSLYGFYYLLHLLKQKWEAARVVAEQAEALFRKFIQGLFSIRGIKNWPLFLFLTVGIWFCYVLMTYIPFWAFDLHEEFQLGMREAFIITVVSALGIALPAPGGIGTYHWLVSRSMWLFFLVPEVAGVAYAIVTHLVMMIIILVVTPLLLLLLNSRGSPDE